jgi:hypothetical protein
MNHVLHYFVDEAGDPTLFNHKGHIIVGNEGCSKFFILGKLDVADPAGLAQEMEALRLELLADPYFAGVPSMQRATGKTAVFFHAKNDVAEVRREVFKLLLRRDLRFYAVVRDKQHLLSYVRQQNERNPAYRYRPNEVYDTLIGELFDKFHRAAEEVRICFSRRGKEDRTRALQAALEKAEGQFERDFGFRRHSQVEVSARFPSQQAGLQAVDYYLWALQRFYEKGEERYVQMLWPQVGEIHDLDHVEEGRRGVFFLKSKPLSQANRKL